MTVSVSPLAKFAAKHATHTSTTTTAGSDGLGDFMALLDQLGITVQADGSTTHGDLLALLGKAEGLRKDGVTGLAISLDKLSAKISGKAADPATTIADAILIAANGDNASGDEKTDPAAALASLLDSLDTLTAQPDESKDGNPNATPDMAHILALLNAMTAQPAAAPEAATANGKGAAPNGVASASPANPVRTMMERMRAALDPTLPTGASGDSSTGTDTTHAQLGERFAALGDAVRAGQEKNPLALTAGSTEGAKIADLIARLNAREQGGTTTQAAPQPGVASVIAPIRDDRTNVADVQISQTVDTGFTITDPLLAGAAGTAQPVDPAADPGSVTENSTETIVQHHLDLARDSEWLDTLARDIARAAQHDSHLKFQLNPEHLGSLKVELINSAQGTSVKLTADTEAARAILTDAQPRLVAEARAQGLRISEATVDLGGQGSQQRQNAEQVVVIRTPVAPLAAEVEMDMPAVSGERYA